MGGTFDPIHHGHLVAASEVQAWFDLDEVIFVPTGEPWQKSDREVSAAEDRYLMTVIATASNPRFSVSRVDIDRGGPTYTIDTLRDLHESRPTAEFFFITGADALAQILTWHDAEQVFELAQFVGCTRPGTADRRRDAAGTAAGPRRPSSRSRRWPSRRPSAAHGRTRASRSGTSSPTASCSTSPSARSTDPPPIRRARSASPAQDPATPPWHPNSRTNPTTKEPRDRH